MHPLGLGHILAWWGLTWRVKPRFELSGGLQRLDALENTGVASCPLLLVAGGELETAATPQLAAGAAISGLAAEGAAGILLRGCYGGAPVVEVIEHQVHVFFRLGGQVGPLQVLLIFVYCDAHSACSDVAGRSGSFLSMFLILKGARNGSRLVVLKGVDAGGASGGIEAELAVVLHAVVAGAPWVVVLLPAAGTRDREVVHHRRARTVLPRR